MTFVMVTHELPSLLAVADRCIMLGAPGGGILAEGDPRALASRADPAVRAFFHRQAA
jgi:phospholipid/cholesterol/gamma-HCH transport system ATP-binding protein